MKSISSMGQYRCLIGISAGDSIPRIGDTLAPTRWQRIDCLIPFNEGCASGD